MSSESKTQNCYQMDGHLYVVDKEAKPKNGELVYDTISKSIWEVAHTLRKLPESCFKIIATTDDAPIFYGVDKFDWPEYEDKFQKKLEHILQQEENDASLKSVIRLGRLYQRIHEAYLSVHPTPAPIQIEFNPTDSPEWKRVIKNVKYE